MKMVELVRSVRTPEEIARELEPSAQAIRNWVSQAGLLVAPPRQSLPAAGPPPDPMLAGTSRTSR